ncbi:MAG: exodeoxyribonuclease VII small subunit [Eubacterium sp.]
MSEKINLTYEQAVSRLEEIVSALEKNEVSLEDSLKLFEEGTRLTAYCSNMLKNAKARITEIEKE